MSCKKETRNVLSNCQCVMCGACEVDEVRWHGSAQVSVLKSQLAIPQYSTLARCACAALPVHAGFVLLPLLAPHQQLAATTAPFCHSLSLTGSLTRSLLAVWFHSRCCQLHHVELSCPRCRSHVSVRASQVSHAAHRWSARSMLSLSAPTDRH